MKELQRLTGGYKRHIDYLLTLQSEVMGVHNALFRTLGHDLVLSGCAITNHENGTVTIAPGVVYVSGQIVRFLGASNVSTVANAIVINPVPVQSDPDEFFDGSTKNTYKEQFAIIGDLTNAATQIAISPNELYNIKQYMHDIVQSYGQKGETKWVVDLDNTFLDNFDASGLGTSARWLGWALMNGNNGTPSMAGRTPIGVGRLLDNWGLEHDFWHNRAEGQPRHQLTISEMPRHRFKLPDNTIPNKRTDYEGDRGSYDDMWQGYRNGLYTEYLGSDAPHNIMQPYRAGYWVIKIE